MVVTAARSQQITRAMKKLKITKTQALYRLRAQMPLQEKARLADWTIDNSKTLQQTQKEVTKIWQELQPKKKKNNT